MTKKVPHSSSLARIGSFVRRSCGSRTVVYAIASFVVSAAVAVTGCATPGNPGPPAGETAVVEEIAPRTSGAGLFFSPWPATVTQSFRETAWVGTDWIGFSHPEGWRLAITAPNEIAIILPDDEVTGRVALLPRYGTPPAANDRLPAGTARFLQWAGMLPGEVVWSDETVAGTPGDPREIFIAVSSTDDRRATGLIWQAAKDGEVIIEYTGSREAVEDATRGMILTAKTVTIPAEAAGGPGRRLETGLTFAPPPGNPDGRWRWREDLAAGFVLSLSPGTDAEAAPGGTAEPGESAAPAVADGRGAPSIEHRVAVWRDEAGTFSFDVLSETEPPEGELRALLTEYLGYREVEGGVR